MFGQTCDSAFFDTDKYATPCEISISYYRKVLKIERDYTLAWDPSNTCMNFAYTKVPYGFWDKVFKKQENELKWLIPISDTVLIPTAFKIYYIMQNDTAFMFENTHFDHEQHVARGINGFDITCSEEVTKRRTTSHFINIKPFEDRYNYVVKVYGVSKTKRMIKLSRQARKEFEKLKSHSLRQEYLHRTN